MSLKVLLVNMVITAKCAHCGAQIVFGETDEVIICKYCDSVNAIPEVPKGKENKEPLLREVIAEIKYHANFIETDGSSQLGDIWITDNELYFKPKKFLLGPSTKRYLRLKDIKGYSTEGIGFIIIYTNKGRMELGVFKTSEIINTIESKRKQYFEKNGLPIPDLKCGNYKDKIKNVTQEGVEVGSTPRKKTKKLPEWQKWALAITILLFMLSKCAS